MRRTFVLDTAQNHGNNLSQLAVNVRNYNIADSVMHVQLCLNILGSGH